MWSQVKYNHSRCALCVASNSRWRTPRDRMRISIISKTFTLTPNKTKTSKGEEDFTQNCVDGIVDCCFKRNPPPDHSLHPQDPNKTHWIALQYDDVALSPRIELDSSKKTITSFASKCVPTFINIAQIKLRSATIIGRRKRNSMYIVHTHSFICDLLCLCNADRHANQYVMFCFSFTKPSRVAEQTNLNNEPRNGAKRKSRGFTHQPSE